MSGSGSLSKVIALVDMDCFYVQVEERDDPSIKGIPAAVVQYKAWKGGGIIAVNYEARAKGVGRNMRGDDAKAVCPEIVLVRVPETNEKANLTKYRDAGKEVLDVICEFSTCVERASIDEAYIDLTEPVNEFLKKVSPFPEHDLIACLDAIDKTYLEMSFPIGFESSEKWLESLRSSEIMSFEDVKLAVGAEIVGRMRKAVLDKTGFKCSAGIAHNKVLAKLGAGMNKPNKQTVIPHSTVPEMYAQTKIKKVRMMGGQFGEALVETFKCENMSDLLQFSLQQFVGSFGEERGNWLYNLARGYDDEPVIQRQLPKSIGCSKNFLGPESLTTKEKTKSWISRLCEEVVDRIERDYEMNNRRAKSLTLHVTFQGRKSFSRSCGKCVPYNPLKMSELVGGIMDKLYKEYGVLPINNLGLIASKLEEDQNKNVAKISSFYAPTTSKTTTTANTTTAPALEEKEDNNSRPGSPDMFENSSPEIEPPPDEPVPAKTAAATSNGMPKSSTNNKLIEATNVHMMPATYTNSDDEVDVEGFTPDSPQVPARTTSAPTDEESDTEDEPILHQPFVVVSKPERSNNVPAAEPPNPSPRKPVFVCTKSPLKKKVPVMSRDNPLSSVFPSLSKYVQNEPSTSKPKPSNEPPKPKQEEQNKQPVLAEQEVATGANNRPLSKEYIQVCSICHKQIPIWEVLTHKDYHVALDLQQQFGFPGINNNNNTNEALPVPSKPPTPGKKRSASTGTRGKSSKRGRSTRSAPSSSSSGTKNTLHSYFLPKN